MGSPQKETRHKAERKAAKVERALEREHRRRAARDAGTAADTPMVAAPPVDPRAPRPSR